MSQLSDTRSDPATILPQLRILRNNTPTMITGGGFVRVQFERPLSPIGIGQRSPCLLDISTLPIAAETLRLWNQFFRFDRSLQYRSRLGAAVKASFHRLNEAGKRLRRNPDHLQRVWNESRTALEYLSSADLGECAMGMPVFGE